MAGSVLVVYPGTRVKPSGLGDRAEMVLGKAPGILQLAGELNGFLMAVLFDAHDTPDTEWHGR